MTALPPISLFTTKTKGKKRHGLWVMVGDTQAESWFISGNTNEVKPANYSLDHLLANIERLKAVEPAEALEAVKSWPEIQKTLHRFLVKHGMIKKAETEGELFPVSKSGGR